MGSWTHFLRVMETPGTAIILWTCAKEGRGRVLSEDRDRLCGLCFADAVVSTDEWFQRSSSDLVTDGTCQKRPEGIQGTESIPLRGKICGFAVRRRACIQLVFCQRQLLNLPGSRSAFHCLGACMGEGSSASKTCQKQHASSTSFPTKRFANATLQAREALEGLNDLFVERRMQTPL